MQLTEKFAKYREIVERLGATAAGESIGMSKSAISMVYHGRYNGDPERVIDRLLTANGVDDNNDEPLPTGYRRNGVGHLVPVNDIKPLDLMRDAVVRKIIQQAVVASSQAKEHRARMLAAIENFCTESASQYDRAMGGVKGNVTLTSFDGKYRVKRAIDEHLECDERLLVAKELVDQCVRSWSRDSRPELRVLINDAFQTDQQNRFNTRRVLGLRRLNIKDATWRMAMDAIGDSITVRGSQVYVRFYERDPDGKYRQIPMGI